MDKRTNGQENKMKKELYHAYSNTVFNSLESRGGAVLWPPKILKNFKLYIYNYFNIFKV